MVKVILSVCVLLGMSNHTQNYKILYLISDAPFYFLPFYIANSAAKKFETNQFIAMVIAGVMLHPNFLDLVSSGHSIEFFNLPVKSVKYGSTVIPIILVVWFMSYIEKFIEKIVPKVLKTMLRPMLLLIITAPLALIVIGPFSPLLVMVGMHLSFTLTYIFVKENGYDASVIVVVLNSSKEDIKVMKKDQLSVNDEFLQIIN